jgi:hypothetical protein
MAEYIRHIKVKAEIETNKTTYLLSETVHDFRAGEEAISEFFDGYREELQPGEQTSLLQDALELLHAALLLRMHGDIKDMPMSQITWDHHAEAFLRAHYNQED